MRQKHELTVPWKDFLAVLDRIDEIEAETSRITDERIRTKDHDYMRKEHNALWDEYHVLDKKHDECGGMIVPMIVEGLAEVDTNHSLDRYVMKGIEKNIFGGKGEHGSIRKFETTSGGHVWLYLDDMKVEDIECYNKKGQYTHTVSFKKRGE